MTILKRIPSDADAGNGRACAAAQPSVAACAAVQPSLLGNCLVDPVNAKGKAEFGFDIGETLVLHYAPEKPDVGFKKFVGKSFTCSLRRYRVRKAKR